MTNQQIALVIAIALLLATPVVLVVVFQSDGYLGASVSHWDARWAWNQ